MLVTDPNDYQIGDFVLVDGIPVTFHARDDSKILLGNLIPKITGSPAFTVLSWLLGRFDKDWRKLKWKPWHTAFLSRMDTDGTWWVSEAKGGVGITESPLNEFSEPYLVFRWFDTPPDEATVKAFIDEYRGEKYDSFWGYLFVILWYFWRWWPLIYDKTWMCWMWLYFFALSFGKPIDKVYHYPLITILMSKLEYPGY